MPNPGGACSGYLVEHESQRLLLECGHGVVSVLRTVQPLSKLSAILVSHMHADHFFDLVPLAYGYLFGDLAAVPLYLPPGGIDTLERLQQAIGLSSRFFADRFELQEFDPDQTLLLDGLSLTFAPTVHYVPAWAIRISQGSDGGKVLAYTSDTAWSDDVIKLLDDASLAIVEAAVEEYDPQDDSHGHLTGTLAGAMAARAAVDRLVLTHYQRERAEELKNQATRAFGRSVFMATERQAFDL